MGTDSLSAQVQLRLKAGHLALGFSESVSQQPPLCAGELHKVQPSSRSGGKPNSKGCSRERERVGPEEALEPGQVTEEVWERNACGPGFLAQSPSVGGKGGRDPLWAWKTVFSTFGYVLQ